MSLYRAGPNIQLLKLAAIQSEYVAK